MGVCAALECEDGGEQQQECETQTKSEGRGFNLIAFWFPL